MARKENATRVYTVTSTGERDWFPVVGRDAESGKLMAARLMATGKYAYAIVMQWQRRGWHATYDTRHGY